MDKLTVGGEGATWQGAFENDGTLGGFFGPFADAINSALGDFGLTVSNTDGIQFDVMSLLNYILGIANLDTLFEINLDDIIGGIPVVGDLLGGYIEFGLDPANSALQAGLDAGLQYGIGGAYDLDMRFGFDIDQEPDYDCVEEQTNGGMDGNANPSPNATYGANDLYWLELADNVGIQTHSSAGPLNIPADAQVQFAGLYLRGQTKACYVSYEFNLFQSIASYFQIDIDNISQDLFCTDELRGSTTQARFGYDVGSGPVDFTLPMNVVDNDESFTDLGLKYVGNVDFFKTDNYVGFADATEAVRTALRDGFDPATSTVFSGGQRCIDDVPDVNTNPSIIDVFQGDFGLGTFDVNCSWALVVAYDLPHPNANLSYVEVQDGWFNFEDDDEDSPAVEFAFDGDVAAVQNARVGTVTFEGAEALPTARFTPEFDANYCFMTGAFAYLGFSAELNALVALPLTLEANIQLGGEFGPFQLALGVTLGGGVTLNLLDLDLTLFDFAIGDGSTVTRDLVSCELGDSGTPYDDPFVSTFGAYTPPAGSECIGDLLGFDTFTVGPIGLALDLTVYLTAGIEISDSIVGFDGNIIEIDFPIPLIPLINIGGDIDNPLLSFDEIMCPLILDIAASGSDGFTTADNGCGTVNGGTQPEVFMFFVGACGGFTLSADLYDGLEVYQDYANFNTYDFPNTTAYPSPFDPQDGALDDTQNNSVSSLVMPGVGEGSVLNSDGAAGCMYDPCYVHNLNVDVHDYAIPEVERVRSGGNFVRFHTTGVPNSYPRFLVDDYEPVAAVMRVDVPTPDLLEIDKTGVVDEKDERVDYTVSWTHSETAAEGDGSLEVGAHITDVLPAGLEYLDESMRITCPDGLPVPLTDADDGDGGTFDDGEFEFELPCGSSDGDPVVLEYSAFWDGEGDYENEAVVDEIVIFDYLGADGEPLRCPHEDSDKFFFYVRDDEVIIPTTTTTAAVNTTTTRSGAVTPTTKLDRAHPDKVTPSTISRSRIVPTPVASVVPTQNGRSVAFTGQNSGWLAMAGITFLALGTLLIGAAMKRRSRRLT
ncbi:MAG: hypothetical protein KAZ88_04375 [Acidimicrobiia bacterium]|nr:hypothetical protein [Acidimicrobiia bacterium]